MKGYAVYNKCNDGLNHIALSEQGILTELSNQFDGSDFLVNLEIIGQRVHDQNSGKDVAYFEQVDIVK